MFDFFSSVMWLVSQNKYFNPAHICSNLIVDSSPFQKLMSFFINSSGYPHTYRKFKCQLMQYPLVEREGHHLFDYMRRYQTSYMKFSIWFNDFWLLQEMHREIILNKFLHPQECHTWYKLLVHTLKLLFLCQPKRNYLLQCD